MKKSAINRKKNKKSRTIRKKNNSSKGRTRLMNEDVMIEILSNLGVKQLLRIEKVSQQFRYCANEVLKRQKGLSINIGRIRHQSQCLDKNHSIFGGNSLKASFRYNRSIHKVIYRISANHMVRYKRQFVITERVINGFDCRKFCLNYKFYI